MKDDELLAQGQILSDQIGPPGGHTPDDDPDEPQKEHHLLSSLMGIGAGVYLAWHGYKDSDGG